MNLRPWPLLFFFVVLSLLLRWGTSFISVINHDESTYIVIAQEILNGKVYLRDVIDTKPIGVFWLYAAIIKLTGGSIPGIRLVTHLFVALTAWACFWAGRRATGSDRVGLAAGIAYLFATSTYTHYGVGPNSELFFNCFTVAALGIGIAPRASSPAEDGPMWHWPLMGVLLGTAVIIKPFAAAESLAMGLFALWYYWWRRREVMRGFLAGGMLVAGFALPLLAVYAYYLRLDMVDELLYYSFTVNSKYPVELAWHLRLKYLGDYLLRYSVLVLPAGAALVVAYRRGINRTWVYFLLGYFTVVTLMILSPGRRFGYYQIQLHPALCLLAAAFMDQRVEIWNGLRRWLSRRIVVYGLVGIATVLGISHFLSYQVKTDRPQMIVEYFRDRLEPGDQYFSVTSHQISYYLLKREVPTRFVHTALMFYDQYVKAFELDERAEAERLLANPNLRYVIRHPKDKLFFTPLSERLLQEFTLVDSLDQELYIYKRKE
ncbi:4-amino-4-deoxy-L-arabinose transferase-like glycosyltransferase [Lewinella aquimaris]|uniref:4-amino-4-deoxy-L-arabinose transferase-like glycosyltransferase n=1 Tax=Neolewinella aquimaris TaxID=1835722 RepID=A0A840E6S0_9BACT|nr:glycosyltransferase family 39 protein [Neolewinella aquimaris]MBB4078907.1 4-amino-4-deoxy-L-arabinose transferase-like glycosyltransferase [Neolewinella aquimaris]